MRLRAVAGLMALLCATCAGERRSPAPAAAPDPGVRGVAMDPELLKRCGFPERRGSFCFRDGY
jgi:hypothetical protein